MSPARPRRDLARALSAKAGSERPLLSMRLRGRPPAEGPRAGPGGTWRPLHPPRPLRGESWAQLRPQGAEADRPRGRLRASPRAPARLSPAAASRGGRQRGACALARSRPGPWALRGGREVGTWAGAGPHTLPARRWRHRHLAAGAPCDAHGLSGAGERAGAAGHPVGGSPPSPPAPRGHEPAKLNLALGGPGRWARAGWGAAWTAGPSRPGALSSPAGARAGRWRGARGAGDAGPRAVGGAAAWPPRELVRCALVASEQGLGGLLGSGRPLLVALAPGPPEGSSCRGPSARGSRARARRRVGVPQIELKDPGFFNPRPSPSAKVRPAEGGREGGRGSNAEVPGRRTQEAIKTPPFGLTTKN